MALIAYSPLEQGLLTGKYRSDASQQIALPITRRFRVRTARLRKIGPLLQVMASIAAARDKTISQVALNWLLAKDERIIPIPGAKNARQAGENAGAIGWRLTEEEFRRIDLEAGKF